MNNDSGKKTLLTAAALTVALLAGGRLPEARAQQPGTPFAPAGVQSLPARNAHEIGVFVGPAASASYGIYAAPRLQWGGTLALSESGRRAATVGAFGNYYFPGSPVVGTALTPYAGVWTGVTHRVGALGVQAGAKYLAGQDLAITGELQSRPARGGGADTRLVLGVSTFFR